MPTRIVDLTLTLTHGLRTWDTKTQRQPDGTVKEAWYGVKADGHAAEVLQALKG